MFNYFHNKKSKEQLFWDWFAKKADLFLNFESNQNYLFHSLKQELNKINPYLVFEFSPKFDDGSREFVISADGIKSVFPFVSDLVRQAPSIKNWKIIAFRQPHSNITQIKYENLIINFDDIFFKYSKADGKINLELNIRGFYESSEWTGATFVLLDIILGEYYTEMCLDFIDKKILKEDNIKDLYPIKELYNIVNDFVVELSN